jgi:uncharacterized protein YndB with AHSA1/START domain
VVEDSIVRETVVAAPVQRVWEVLTQAEYVGRWFGASKADIDLRPGGSFVMTWEEHGVGLARVERVEEPTLFSFRWAVEPGIEPKPGEETLVEFTLAEKGDGTLLRVVESGFSKLDRPAEKQEWHRERNVDGWRQVLEAVAAGVTSCQRPSPPRVRCSRRWPTRPGGRCSPGSPRAGRQARRRWRATCPSPGRPWSSTSPSSTRRA